MYKIPLVVVWLTFDVVGHRRKAPPLRFGWIFRPGLGSS